MALTTMHTRRLILRITLAVSVFFSLAEVPQLLAATGDIGDVNSRETSGPVQAQGISAGSFFDDVGGTAVNAFSFDFVLAHSAGVGFSYPENAGLSLQATRYYNSNFDRIEYVGCYIRNFRRVRRQNPMGLGWDFNFGRVIQVQNSDKRSSCSLSGAYSVPPRTEQLWAYISPDGAKSILEEYDVGVYPQEYRSHNGTHIRALKYSTHWELHFPDGTVYEMAHEVTGTVFNDFVLPGYPTCVRCLEPELDCPSLTHNFFIPDSDLTGTYDRDWIGWYTTNVYTKAETGSSTPSSYAISYHAAPLDYIPATITDRHSRQIDVTVDIVVANPTYGLITEITVPAPADGAGTARTGNYKFAYEALTGGLENQSVLTKVEGPAVDGGRYTHIYENNGPKNSISSIRYPQGKLEVYTYAQFDFKTNDKSDCPCPGESRGRTRSPKDGIELKTVYLDGDSNNEAPENKLTWTFSQHPKYSQTISYPNCYEGQGFLCNNNDVREFNHQIHTMIDPAGNTTTRLFSTPSIPHDSWGYPMMTAPPAQGRLLRERFYQGPYDPTLEAFGPWDPTTNTEIPYDPVIESVNLVKEVQYEYAEGLDSGCMSAFETLQDKIETRHYEIPGDPLSVVSVVEERSDFDEFGHYQETKISGNGVGPESKIVRTDYAADNLNGFGQPCSDAVILQDNWLGNVVLREENWSLVGGTETLVNRTERKTDLTTGQTTKTVQRLNPSGQPSPCNSVLGGSTGDIVTDYTFTDDGDLASTTVLEAGASGQDGIGYRTEFTYSYGVVDSRKQEALPYYDFQRVIDPSTGLAVEERLVPVSLGDTSGGITLMEYDVFGRKTRAQFANEEPVVWAFENDALAGGGVRLARIRSMSGTGDQQTEAVANFDLAGRISRIDQLLQDGTSWSYLYSGYDSAGRPFFTSEWTTSPNFSTALAGTTLNYTDPVSGYEDPFDRPRSRVGPLGEETQFEYFGTNVQTTVKNVSGSTATEGLVDSITTQYTDGLGRLRAVDSSAGVDAIYDYDLNGSLAKVNLVDSVVFAPTVTDRYATSNANGQVRTFEFDKIGRQFRTTQPENGTTETLAWTALGSPKETRDALGADRGHFHRSVYDSAGRSIRTERVLSEPINEIDEIHSPGSANWVGTGWNLVASSPCLDGATGWYMGNATSCDYAQGVIESADLVSTDIPETGVIEPGTTLSFDHFREVRNGVGQTSSRDQFIVEVRDAAALDWSGAEEIYRIDSTQISWNRWQRTPALSLETWVDKRIQIRFRFDSVDDLNNTSAAGIGIGDVRIQRPSVLVLAETEYDNDFGVTGNNARGQVSQVLSHDEATQDWTHRTKYYYENDGGRLSAVQQSVDWDRSGILRDFESSYSYDSLGRLLGKTLPHKPGDEARTVDYAFRHGQMSGITSTYDGDTVDIVPGDSVNSGFAYHAAGGIQAVTYGNGTTTTISPNAAYLPDSISVTKGTGTLWQTGSYSHDGARNITGIGSDSYWYDKVGRLTEALVHTSAAGMHPDGLGIAYTYDRNGNMTDRVTSYNGGTGTPPNRMAFSGRTFSTNFNQITDAGYSYDQNGNLLEEPTEEGIAGKRYRFDSQNRLPLVQSLTSGTLYQQAQYEASGNRWVQLASADRGGEARLTLRGLDDLVESEFVFDDALSAGEEDKHYIRGGSQLLAIHSRCGPAPTLSISPSGTPGRADFIIGLPLGTTPTASHIVTAEDDFGNTLSFTVPQSLTSFYKLDNQLLSGHQVLRVKLSLECGESGYSNAVSYTPEPSPPSCMTSMAVSHSNFLQIAGQPNRSTLMMMANDNDCASGTAFNLYFREEGTPTFAKIAGPLTIKSEYEMLNTPVGAGRGEYMFREYFPVTKQEGNSSAIAKNLPAGSSGGSGGIPGQGDWKTEYVHWDHLGSTRAMTDEMGIVVSELKFYPFGEMAEQTGSSDSRLKFTGHERDEDSGLNYLLARYCGPSLGRFLSVDPIAGSREHPQSWNRYAYTRSNPIRLVDPDGKDPIEFAKAFGRGLYESGASTVAAFTTPTSQYGIVEALSLGFAVYNYESTIDGIEQRAKEHLVETLRDHGLDGHGRYSGFVAGEAAQLYIATKGGSALLKATKLAPVVRAARGATAGLRQVTIKSAHGARHLEGTGLASEAVESAITKHVQGATKGASETGSFWGRVTVEEQSIEYRAFTLPDGTINVGTYYPPVP